MKLIQTFNEYIYISANNFIIRLNYTSNDHILYNTSEDIHGYIVCIELSMDGRYLFATFSSKWIYVWDTIDSTFVSKRIWKKRITSLLFVNFIKADINQTVLIFSDKFGEILAIDAPLLSKDPVLCGAHTTSLITDMVVTDKYCISSDRDEKIRITSYPNMLNIVTYCLGHTSVVTSISLLSNDYLISVGWDYQMILWDFKFGKSLLKINLIAYEPTTDKILIPDIIQNVSAEFVEEINTVEDIIEVDKVFDENKVGNYPLKVINHSIDINNYLVFIIFKGVAIIDIYKIENIDGIFKYNLLKKADLQSLPIDIVVIDNIYLNVILAAPFYMTLIDINDFSFVQKAYVGIFRDICISKEIKYDQKFIASENDDDNENSFRKHSLDKRYNKESVLDHKANKKQKSEIVIKKI